MIPDTWLKLSFLSIGKNNVFVKENAKKDNNLLDRRAVSGMGDGWYSISL